MSIKDLFGKKSNKIVTKEQADKLVDEVESHEYVSENNKGKRKFLPKVDYSDPKNFAKYGSAEKYYEDTVEHIYGSYPYDGSDAEKNKWHRESSPLDSYVFEKDYPKAVGHIFLNGTPGVSNLVVEAGAGSYTKYIQPQYVYIQGGPNKDKRVSEGDEYELSKQFPTKGGRANIWDEDVYRESNLGINPDVGNSIEFWYKLEDDSIIASNKAFCLFDLWNGQDHSHSDYVRLLVETLPESGNDFSLTYKFGSGAEGAERVGLNLSAATKATLGVNYLQSWNHYSFTMKSTATGIVFCLYVNGVLEDTVTSGNQITSSVPQENYVAIINAYNTKPTSSSPSGIVTGVGGAPRLYIDDFRFWKAERNGRDVGRNWFTSVSGGTNTDDSKYSTVDNVDIGVYYKFNEGLLDSEEINSQDAVALDYSGRISNGTIQNYTLQVRKLTSAIDECSLVEEKETPEPIIYSTHPDVQKLMTDLKEKGFVYDNKNNASFYHTMPEWILQEDEDHSFKIKELTQALSSYFDSLHLQIEALTDLRANDYQTLVGKADKPYYFAKNLLRSVGFDVTDLFNEATILEEIASRGETELFDMKIQEIKNVIYQNIYNNITHIYKTKGTEKSFRNLIRCFGIDDELVKINLYADGVDYTLEGRRSFTSVKKNYVDFNNVDRHESIVYSEDVDAGSTDERSYILGPTAAQSALLGTTLTAEVIFPKQLEREHPSFALKPFTEISLFGTKEANVAGGVLVDHVETANNIGSFRVFAVKPDPESLNVKFKLVYTDADGDHELLTEEYKEVYDNNKWNIAVRLRPIDVELGDHVSGASVGEYQIDFYGVNATLDTIENEFKLTASYTGAEVAKAQAMIQSDKLCYVGALRTNLAEEATEVAKSDVKVTDLMYWFDYLTDEEIKIHAIDASNFGRLYPNDDAYSFFSELSDGTSSDIRVPRKDTLALYWNFQNVSSSDASGNFVVNDFSLGGSDYIAESRYGWFTDLIGYRHQAKGAFKPALPNDNQVVNREYQYTARHRLPEVLAGDDMVEIRTQDDNIFVKGSKPINHFFAIEKSMSQVISTEMLSLFASIVEFNDLIGQPVNRYRMQYKSLEKFRSLFYERVENVPSFEKYVEFYKWIDSSLGLMLQQLIPASGNFSESMRNMVENHILERSKYWTKFPTLEKKQDPPEGTIRGIRELTYDWEHGHAPLGTKVSTKSVIGDPVNTKAILFNGVSSSVLVEDSVERYRFTLDETAQSANAIPGQGDLPFTISAWVYLDGAPTNPSSSIVTKLNNATSQREYWLYALPSGQFGFGLYDDWSATGKQLRVFTPGASPIATNQWVHIVATYGANFTFAADDGDPATHEPVVSGDMKIYINGVDSGGLPFHFDLGPENYEAMPANQDDFSSLIFGNSHIANAPFNGRIADVAIFNKHFTAEEAAECYGEGSVIEMSLHSAANSLVGWWKMGDDKDATGTGGIKNYAITESPATLLSGAQIVDVPTTELSTEYFYYEDENCLWRKERAERSDDFVTSDSVDVDNDRESIRSSVVRDVLGQTKMVKVGTELVEQGKPTLYDVSSGNTYEGSTYATRRLSRPYNLNIDKKSSIGGGPNFSDSLVASANDTVRASTSMGSHIEVDNAASMKDAEICFDGYNIIGGPKSQKRRAQEIKLFAPDGTETALKGSLLYNSLYGAHPHDPQAEFQNLHHDSYGQDHEVPVQGPFTNQWVGGNQHRHIDLNTGTDNEDSRPELYKIVSDNLIKHPYDVAGSSSPSGVYAAARYTRDGLAKRPLNIANIKTSTDRPKLGNYTYDYEVVQTSGRSNNNRWLTRNPNATPDSIPSTYVTGLYDYTLPVRGRSEHVFVERFSAPGSPSTMSRGSLDYQAEEFSPYNSLNFRNLRVRNHLNFWHKEHSKQFGYREDYIHGTPDDAIDGVSNDFGGNTDGVASWHKNNRNAAIRMKLQGDNVYAERSYDNFFVGHQIPRSSWQYSWISASAVQPDYAGLVVIDDEHRDVVSATTFPYDHDGNPSTAVLTVHPRYHGYVTEYPNASIDLSGRHGLLSSASYASYELDFSYGNTAVAEEVDYDTQTIGSSCESCKLNFAESSLDEATGDNLLNAILINRNGPYQGAGWMFLQNARNPIVRRQRRRNEISIQNSVASSNPFGHEKYVEPSATWNKPIYHLLSEISDGVGTKVIHSYSNNLEGFANPKLTKRTGFAKRSEQFYDRLFEYYNPNNDEETKYDFIGLSYKEYVFPKHRNVGLHKVRSRVMWDVLSPKRIAESATGDLRTFWKDRKAQRVKSYTNLATLSTIDAANALGYYRINKFAYLNLDPSVTEHIRYDRSIFSMDAFEARHSEEAGDYTKFLGDLQYTGKENYFAFILARRNLNQKMVPYSPEVEEGVTQSPLQNYGSVSVIATSEPMIIQGASPAVTNGVTALQQSSQASADYGYPQDGASWTLIDNPVADITVGVSYDDNSTAAVLESLYGTSIVEEATPNPNLPLDIAPPLINTAAIQTSVLAQLTPPEPVVQLYYNPFNAKYEEEAWLYNSNVLSGKNPWHNSYADFNLESRAMAQNYGLVAEFRISEHMDKYLFEAEAPGEFQGPNYNIFSVEGASYDVHSNKETRYSGTTRYTTEKKFFINPSQNTANFEYPRRSDAYVDSVISLGLYGNNAVTTTSDEYVRYKRQNPIYIGGTQTVENSLPVVLGNPATVISSTSGLNNGTTWAKKSSDDSGTGRHRYFANGRELDSSVPESEYIGVKYREPDSHPQWNPIMPYSNGPLTSLSFNRDVTDTDFMEGVINRTVDTEKGLEFLKSLTQVGGDTPEYQSATPFAFSVWVKPDGNSECKEDETYDGKIKGLATFGTYVDYDGRKIPMEHLAVYSNFPMPESFKSDPALVEKYKNGMGLTLYLPSINDTKKDISLVDGVNLFHFFDKNGNPAVLDKGSWKQVVVRVLPAFESSSPMKIKVNIGFEELYGIHRGLLVDNNYVNKAYECVPVEQGTAGAWATARYGNLVANKSLSTTMFKLGKSRFANPDEMLIGGPVHNLESDGKSQYYFKGEMMEFSLWQGVLSDKDVRQLVRVVPSNILESHLNGEILGGYVKQSAAEDDWGNQVTEKIFSGIGLGDGAGAITYTVPSIGLSMASTRSKFALLAWHRLGIYPAIVDIKKCEDWDDNFFDSYVHTDPVRFYDNIVEDHDAVTDTAVKRIRLKVNALKKLIPYRGFYPQDRTLQLAKLFSDKMSNSIDELDDIHHEQSLQAALQPFFAPGILYNSIKAGVAVDWPAFTNESGLEPTKVLENITLPHEEDFSDGPIVKTSVAPNWYVKRRDEYDARLAIAPYDESGMIENGRLEAEEAVSKSYQDLVTQQPKHFASSDNKRRRGYVILAEPNTRIPFEGLVALDSVLPSKNSTEAEIASTNVADVTFKHVDLVIQGWEAELSEILISQPEPVNGYGNPSDYLTPDTITLDKIKIVTKSITIGDPSIDESTSYDVEVNFRRSPLGFNFPNEIGSPAFPVSTEQVSLEALNEELAVKICRAINKRPDIHFVAVPGYVSWERGDTFSLEEKTTDDILASMMPVSHPEVFGLTFEDPESNPQAYDRLLKLDNLGADAYKNPDSPTKNIIGDQGDGTWRIRLVYVGLPKLELDLSVVDIEKTQAGNSGADYQKLSVKPFDGGSYDANTDGKDLTSWSEFSYASPALGGTGVDGYNPFQTNWKEAHLVSPWLYTDDPEEKTYWNVANTDVNVSGIPYSFFDGGGWLVRTNVGDRSLAELCMISLKRHRNTLMESRWIPGYGWFGYPKYSVDNRLGVHYVSSDGRSMEFGWWGFDEDDIRALYGGINNIEEVVDVGDNLTQGLFHLYGGIEQNQASNKIRVTPEPHKIYLMAPEYYVEDSLQTGFASAATVSYHHPYFEYLGNNGDMRFEMAMHNFLAEVPNFFLKQGKLTSFVSKQEKDFKTMEAGKTYYMDVTMHKSEEFATAMSPYSDGLGKNDGTQNGRYYGPAFKWQSDDDYKSALDLDQALIGDPAQAPYVPPYFYGKSIARLQFECTETRKYSLEEILAGVEVTNLAPEQINKFVSSGASLDGAMSSPAWRARTTISSSMNLFGKATAKNIEYSAQSSNLFDDVNEELQKYVPQIAKDPEGSDNDVWTIGTKFECPILNFYGEASGMVRRPGVRSTHNTEDVVADTPRGTGLWSTYGRIPATDRGVFVTIEDTFKQSNSFGVPKNSSAGSLIDICGFSTEQKKVGDIAEQKEISEAVVMIPFVDTPSETTAETVKVDGRNFFKINKDLFKLQKANVENGKNAISAGEYLGVEQDIPETSISRMIRGMKKYNLPPRFDFVRYPLKGSQHPFVIYFFEFNHILSRNDLANIWQGLPPALADTAVHDSATFVHDLSPVDFFEENTLPKNVRWMVFKVKRRANDNYFATTSDSSDDERFRFDFEFGKTPPKYNYNWPYDFFTMLEMVQVEAGLDIMENKVVTVPQVQSNQSEISTGKMSAQLAAVKNKSKLGDNE